MSSLSKMANGSWRYQTVCEDEKRRTVYFGKIQKNLAQTLQNHFDRVDEAGRFKQSLDAKTQNWLLEQPDGIKDKLRKLGFIDDFSRLPQTVGAFCDFLIDDRKPSPESRRKLLNARNKLVEKFGSDTLLGDVTRGDAQSFFNWMRKELKLSESHSRRTIGYAKEFFIAAVDYDLIPEEPFKNLSARVRANKERQFYVDVASSQKVLETSLMPFGGCDSL